ncbi:hypothetical protein BJ170DRAFT_595688 [Xylariales sp. AK1849]|nr:hypothetical protein BJ170DRAFT_595688 [Xylariales sp. AK1849]
MARTKHSTQDHHARKLAEWGDRQKAMGSSNDPSMKAPPPYKPFHPAPYLGGDKIDPSDGSKHDQQERRIYKMWDDRNAVLKSPLRIISFHFSEKFKVKNHHTDALLHRGEKLCGHLEDFRAGSTAYGAASGVDNGAINRLARGCPKLKQVTFEGAPRLTDWSLDYLLDHCRDLQYINVSGSDRCLGKIKGDFLDRLMSRESTAKQLRKIVLLNQRSLQHDTVRMATATRQGLEICVGHGGGDIKTYWNGQELGGDGLPKEEDPKTEVDDLPPANVLEEPVKTEGNTLGMYVLEQLGTFGDPVVID